MKFLRKNNTSPKTKIPNDIQAFTTKDYLFYRRIFDGKWNCISPSFGNQESLEYFLIEGFYKDKIDEYRKGDRIRIEF